MEGQPSGVLLSTLQAKDPDEGENGTVFYSLSGTAPAGSAESFLHLSRKEFTDLFHVLCKEVINSESAQ